MKRQIPWHLIRFPHHFLHGLCPRQQSAAVSCGAGLSAVSIEPWRQSFGAGGSPTAELVGCSGGHRCNRPLSADAQRRVVVARVARRGSDNDNARLRPWLVAARYMVPMSLALGDAAYDKSQSSRFQARLRATSTMPMKRGMPAWRLMADGRRCAHPFASTSVMHLL
jgi:hypothetical protein